MQAGGRRLWAALELLDRQLVDCDGELCGKVDDLRFELPSEPDGRPVLRSILLGPGALGHRIGGRAGRWLESVERRLRAEDKPTPAEIGFGVVKEIHTNLDLSLPSDQLPGGALETWLRERVIGRIPGAHSGGGHREQQQHQREAR